MRLPPEREVLEAGVRELGIDASAAQIDALIRIVDELEAANAQFNLTAIRDRPGMLSKHLLDSLSLQPFLRGSSVADIGTGAGFPGLPLAVVNPGRRFALIEATGKKARFVAQTANLIAIDNVLWGGAVVQPGGDADTVALQRLNDKLHADPRVDISLLPIGDGVTLARKR